MDHCTCSFEYCVLAWPVLLPVIRGLQTELRSGIVAALFWPNIVCKSLCCVPCLPLHLALFIMCTASGFVLLCIACCIGVAFQWDFSATTALHLSGDLLVWSDSMRAAGGAATSPKGTVYTNAPPTQTMMTAQTM